MRRNKAFTLIELLIVIAIIGILATLIIVFLGDASRRSKDASIKSNASSIKTALERYKTENNSYPQSGTLTIETLVNNYLSSYFASGTKVYSHPAGTDALYKRNSSAVASSLCPSVAACYMQVWTLLSKSDKAYDGPIIGSGLGNGVYYVCKGSNDPYTLTITGVGGIGNHGCSSDRNSPLMRGFSVGLIDDTTADRMFITYGPQ